MHSHFLFFICCCIFTACGFFPSSAIYYSTFLYFVYSILEKILKFF
ncbi:hypothetical protein HMPREF9443_02121 [Phascolarctobacterium succinatutens YIT 12067]|uniref:Uncharacterized protein n=1 Tax=Phascolarctobacterium succinatutens YIT 12067 TaxID=626939 RepID=E8LGW5_9FIRM|nr:hypothetical protein HMPREF9443_02121 [Phascolarctobacterium succinatutens YIT 12067]